MGQLTNGGKLNRRHKNYELTDLILKLTHPQLYGLVEQFNADVKKKWQCETQERIFNCPAGTGKADFSVTGGEWNAPGMPGYFMYEFASRQDADAFVAFRAGRKRQETIDEILQDLENE